MLPNFAFHDVEKIELTEVVRLARPDGSDFWTRNLVLYGQGGRYTVPLYSDREDGLEVHRG